MQREVRPEARPKEEKEEVELWEDRKLGCFFC